MAMIPANEGSKADSNHAKCANFNNRLEFILLHTLVLGFGNVALVETIVSYNFSLLSPITLNPDGITNSNTMPMTSAKDRHGRYVTMPSERILAMASDYKYRTH